MSSKRDALLKYLGATEAQLAKGGALHDVERFFGNLEKLAGKSIEGVISDGESGGSTFPIAAFSSGPSDGVYYVDPGVLYAGDDANDGSFSSPMKSIQAAIDRAVEEHGHLASKTIYVLPNVPQEAGTTDHYTKDGVIIRTRNLHIEALGVRPHTIQCASAFGASTDIPMLVTNMTDAGLAAFKAAGGISFNLDPWSWTGASLEGREVDMTLVPENSDFNPYELNITIKNFQFSTNNTVADIGTEAPGLAFLFSNGSTGERFVAFGARVEDCEFSAGRVGLFMHDFVYNPEIDGCKFNVPYVFLNSAPIIARSHSSASQNTLNYDCLIAADDLGFSSPWTLGGFQAGLTTGRGAYLEGLSGKTISVSDSLFASSSSQVGVIFGPFSRFGAEATTSEAGEQAAIIKGRSFTYKSAETSRAGVLTTGEFQQDAGTIIVGSLDVQANAVINGGSLTCRKSHVEGNLILNAGTLDFHGDVFGNVTLASGSTVAGFKGRIFGTLTDPDNLLGFGGGYVSGDYINV